MTQNCPKDTTYLNFMSLSSSLLNSYSGNDREQDLCAYEGKQLGKHQETPFFTFFIYVKLQDIFAVFNQ